MLPTVVPEDVLTAPLLIVRGPQLTLTIYTNGALPTVNDAIGTVTVGVRISDNIIVGVGKTVVVATAGGVVVGKGTTKEYNMNE